MDRLFGALILSLALLTTAVVASILSEGLLIVSVICIGLAALIGLILLTNTKEEIIRPEAREEIEKGLDED
ncbi:hypothetical protein [Rossellomorea sp. NS-SX7]|uniref:hypothetical protein n=1 Tax=Rossellomorea sp. NS-SX7 TaxID=3463856 RepID=UPI0040581E20